MMRNFLRRLARKVENDFNSKLLALLEKNKNARFLDLGCYDGKLTLEMAKKVGTARIFGVEIEEELRNLAQKNGLVVKSFDLNGRFDFDDSSADAVFSNQVIEHLFDVDNFVSEVHRILAPGGYAVIGTVNIASWHNIFSLVLGWQPFDYVNIIKKRWRVGNPITLHHPDNKFSSNLHVKPFTIRALKEIFQVYGFSVEAVIGGGYYPLPYPLFKLASSIDPHHAAFIGFKIRKK